MKEELEVLKEKVHSVERKLEHLSWEVNNLSDKFLQIDRRVEEMKKVNGERIELLTELRSGEKYLFETLDEIKETVADFGEKLESLSSEWQKKYDGLRDSCVKKSEVIIFAVIFSILFHLARFIISIAINS